MSNKDKQTMDYWRHSTNLFEETNMELAVTNQGFEAYGVYCFLMEKINYDITGGLIMDEDKFSLFARKVNLSVRKFKEVLNELLKRGLFNQDLYDSSKTLTNHNSESGKELVISKRQVKKNYIANKRKESNVEFYNGIVVNKDIDKDKDIDKVIDRDRDIDIDKDKLKESKSSDEPTEEERLEFERLKEEWRKRKNSKKNT